MIKNLHVNRDWLIKNRDWLTQNRDWLINNNAFTSKIERLELKDFLELGRKSINLRKDFY